MEKAAPVWLLALLVPAACAPSKTVRRGAPPAFETVVRIPPEQWPALSDDLPAAPLAQAGERSIAYLRKLDPEKLLSVGGREVGAQLLIDTIEDLSRIRASVPEGTDLAPLLKDGFELYRVRKDTDPRSAHFSSYYQPVLEAGREKSDAFPYPIFKKPPDLVSADLGAFDAKLKGRSVVGRVADGALVPYFDRRDIDIRGELDGKGLEIAWLANQFDRLNLHIQGSGRLRFPDGAEAMARFAATNALPYRSVGLSVVGSGAMTREELNFRTLKEYLADHPEGESWLLARDPRYTFFELSPLPAGGEPSGSIGESLTARRSIAVDPSVLPLGTVAFMKLVLPEADEQGRLLGKAPVSRFVHCQDTGGAIKGPGRVDIYSGHGPRAKAVAHNVWDKGELFLLLKKL